MAAASPIQAGDTRLRYGTVAMTLHWLIALLLIGNLCSGFFFASLATKDMNIGWLVGIHKSSGLTVLVLSLVLLGWRLMHKWPELPADMGTGLRALARGAHVLLFALMIAIPLTGWAMISASARGTTTWFGLFPVPFLPILSSLPAAQRHPTHELFETWHGLLAYGTAGLLVLHVAGALYHHYARKDQVLKRMWFGTRVTAPVGAPTDATG